MKWLNRFWWMGMALFAAGWSSLWAQQTVGLFQHGAAASPGYNLFAPLSGTTTYLIDNCGREIRQWPGSYNPGSSVYLQPDGILLRTARINSNVFFGGGIGGRLERLNWNGVTVWEYSYASSTYHQHHDVEYLPNGNILVVAWERKSIAEAIQAGRDPFTSTAGLWPDHIVELEPVGSNGANIVWEWHAWDHLIQDFDPSKDNFGVVQDHPELIDVNLAGGTNGEVDWLHFNAVAYNPQLDQIVLSVHNLHEFWVIDHSTTTAEAASHSGGNSGKGGDLLYRWGNPQNYRRGNSTDRQLFGQHDVRWIADSLPGAGSFILYNNGLGRPAGAYSSVEVITPPAIDAQGNYALDPGQKYGPASPSWIYTAPVPTDFYSSNISGASRLPNGNTLICEGTKGRLFEVDDAGNTVWDYVSPIALGSAVAQGDLPSGNFVFRVERYAPDYPGLQGKALTPGPRLELNPLPLPSICFAQSASDPQAEAWKVGPVPFEQELRLQNPLRKKVNLQVWTPDGRKVLERELPAGETVLDTGDWIAGVYLLRIEGQAGAIKAVKF